MDCSPSSSSLHMIFKARILEWVAISYSGGSSDPRIEPESPGSPALAGGFFTTAPPGKHLKSPVNFPLEVLFPFPFAFAHLPVNELCDGASRTALHGMLQVCFAPSRPSIPGANPSAFAEKPSVNIG